ncbi:hypothetical protein [Muricoccus radiodurans]
MKPLVITAASRRLLGLGLVAGGLGFTSFLVFLQAVIGLFR